jgi:ankyrin repeat protein
MATKVERKILKANAKFHSCRSDLYEAAVGGDLNRTQSLVLSGSIVNDHSKHYDGQTPLFGACGSRNVDVVKYLLRCGGDPTTISKSGFTCFHESARAGYLPVLKILSEYREEQECPNGIDIWSRNNAGWSSFHWAVYSGSKKVVGWVLESDQRRRTVEEAEEKEAEKIAGRTVLSKEEQELEDSDDESYEGFMFRVVDVVRSTTTNGYTPLHIACERGVVNVMMFLMNRGALLGARTREGNIFLFFLMHISLCQCVMFVMFVMMLWGLV